MLTAAVRDLHRAFPGAYVTDVQTSSPELWENNPYLTWLGEDFQNARAIDCQCPLIRRSNDLPFHYLHAFLQFLGEQLGVSIPPTAFKGDIHLSNAERNLLSPVAEVCGEERPFWLICAGGQRDFTIKWWDSARYQEVVDHYCGLVGTRRLGTLLNDIRPRNMGANGLIFDPAFDPITKALWYSLLPAGAAAGGYVGLRINQ